MVEFCCAFLILGDSVAVLEEGSKVDAAPCNVSVAGLLVERCGAQLIFSDAKAGRVKLSKVVAVLSTPSAAGFLVL